MKTIVQRLLIAVVISAGFLPVAPAADIDAVYRRHGAAHGVDWRLLKAVAMVESSERVDAENPDGLSSGLMQIYCAPAHAPVCRNVFHIADWPPPSRAALYDPERNCAYGAQILAWNLSRYGLAKAVAVYNSRSARRTPPGARFPNQRYVDAVLTTYRQLGGSTP